MTECKCPKCGAVLSVTAKEQPSAKAVTVDSVKAAFPEDLGSQLTFEDKGDKIVLKPQHFLGSETFAKVASVVRGLGGEYVSAGKSSHFKVSKKVSTS
jgi:hypothetical protein